MKTIILSTALTFLMIILPSRENLESSEIKQTIIDFAKAGDENDLNTLKRILDDNYRIVMNRLFGSDEIKMINKEMYLSKIKSKEWGGDNRKVEVREIIYNGNSASAIVNYKGEKMSFTSIIDLIKDKEDWKIIAETPKM